MDIKTKRFCAWVLIAVLTFLSLLALFNCAQNGLNFVDNIIFSFIATILIFVLIYTNSVLGTTKEEAEQEYKTIISRFERNGYVAATTKVSVAPYFNPIKKSETKQITVFQDSFLMSEAKATTKNGVCTIWYKEYVVIYDELNDQSVLLLYNY